MTPLCRAAAWQTRAVDFRRELAPRPYSDLSIQKIGVAPSSTPASGFREALSWAATHG
jgi:hypothetical protein